MPTIRGQLLRLELPSATTQLIGTILYIVALAFLALCGFLFRKCRRWWIPGTVLTFTVGTFSLPYIHIYDLLIMMPALGWLLFMQLSARNRPLLAVTAVLLTALSLPVYGFLHYAYLLAGNNIWNIELLVLIAISLVAMLTVYRLKGSRDARLRSFQLTSADS